MGEQAQPQQDHPLAITALCNAIASKKAKAAAESIADGSMATVNLTASVDAIVSRSDATKRVPTVNLLSKGMIAELVRRLGATRSSFHKHMLDLATEVVIEQRTVAKDLVTQNEELLHSVKEVEDQLLAKLPKVDRRGQLSVKAKTRFVSIDFG